MLWCVCVCVMSLHYNNYVVVVVKCLLAQNRTEQKQERWGVGSGDRTRIRWVREKSLVEEKVWRLHSTA